MVIGLHIGKLRRGAESPPPPGLTRFGKARPICLGLMWTSEESISMVTAVFNLRVRPIESNGGQQNLHWPSQRQQGDLTK